MSEQPVSMPECREIDDRQRQLAYLTQIDLFAELDMSDLEEINQAMPMVSCRPGKVFYRPNETGEIMFLLKKGRVHLYRAPAEGKKILLAEVRPGSIFGEMAVTGQAMYDTYAETVEESLLCIMNRRDVEKFISTRPKVALRLFQLIGKRLRQVQDRLEHTAFSNVERRIAAMLLILRADCGSDVLSLTHQELADYLGVYRETVTVGLNGLRQEGLIDTHRLKVNIKNVEGLRQKAFPQGTEYPPR